MTSQVWLKTLEPTISLANTSVTRVLVEEHAESWRKSTSGMHGPAAFSTGARYFLKTMVAVSTSGVAAPIRDLLYWEGAACLVSCECQIGFPSSIQERPAPGIPWRTILDGQPIDASLDKGHAIMQILKKGNGEAQSWEWTMTLAGRVNGLLRAEELKPIVRLFGRGIEPPDHIVSSTLSEYRQNRTLLLSTLHG